jgi:hypothetical protein
MKRYLIKTVIILTSLLFLAFIIIFSPSEKKWSIIIPDTNERIFFKMKVWGLHDAEQRIFISTEENSDWNSSKCYLADGEFNYFYEIKKDSLIVYSFPRFSIPINFTSTTKIIIKEIDNGDYQNLSRNYKKYNLKKIYYYGEMEKNCTEI